MDDTLRLPSPHWVCADRFRLLSMRVSQKASQDLAYVCGLLQRLERLGHRTRSPQLSEIVSLLRIDLLRLMGPITVGRQQQPTELNAVHR